MDNTIITVAGLMELSARTAPKGGGKDFIIMKTLNGEDIKKLGDAMIEWGKKENIPGFIRDGNNINNSVAVVLIGIKDAQPAGFDCGACGFEQCNHLIPEDRGQFRGPNCLIRVLDLGIAIGSAVKTASIHNVDNRIMYRAGMIARVKRFIDADYVMGIPLSSSGKNIYFDR
jgi:uncharacterized ferredoxin-like protein